MAGSFLYNPQSNYGFTGIPGPWGKAKSYLDTYAGGLDAELNPEAYYTHRLAQSGLGGLDSRSNIGRGLYGRVQDAYGAARLKNNQLTWKNFLDPLNFNELLNGMSMSEKGQRYANVVPYDVRWLQRP